MSEKVSFLHQSFQLKDLLRIQKKGERDLILSTFNWIFCFFCHQIKKVRTGESSSENATQGGSAHSGEMQDLV